VITFFKEKHKGILYIENAKDVFSKLLEMNQISQELLNYKKNILNYVNDLYCTEAQTFFLNFKDQGKLEREVATLQKLM
jgi:hypothetical protein